MINLSDVTNIEVKASLLISTCEVTVGRDVKHIFKMLPNHADEYVLALEKIWRNARSLQVRISADQMQCNAKNFFVAGAAAGAL